LFEQMGILKNKHTLITWNKITNMISSFAIYVSH
jgi:hypothetical protein